MLYKAEKQVVALLILLFLILIACAPTGSQSQPVEDTKMPNRPTAVTAATSDTAAVTNTVVVTTNESSSAEAQPQSTDSTGTNWTTYEQNSGLFTIDYPKNWSVEEPDVIDSSTPVNIWQFRGEQATSESMQGVTLGRYATQPIPAEMSLETWFQQVENNEFEFERLRAESIKFKGLDAYTIHDLVRPPERDVYLTYFRCQDRVWFLHTIDADIDSMEAEEIYNHMLDSLSLTCEE